MNAPEKYVIISYFQKTLEEYYDAIEEFTSLLDSSTADVSEDTLNASIEIVSRKRAKLVTTVQSARYHYNDDLGMKVPFFYPNGGFC